MKVDAELDLKKFAENLLNLKVNAEDGASFRGEFTLWTFFVKKWLEAEGDIRGYRSIYSIPGAHEFMLDFVWWKDDPQGGSYAALGCEIEWGNTRDPKRNPGRIAEDFDKLLSFKAPFMLMIFDSYGVAEVHKKSQEETIKELNKYLQDYGDHRVGEQYLVVDISKLRSAWFCKILQDHDINLHLKPLQLSLSS